MNIARFGILEMQQHLRMKASQLRADQTNFDVMETVHRKGDMLSYHFVAERKKSGVLRGIETGHSAYDFYDDPTGWAVQSAVERAVSSRTVQNSFIQGIGFDKPIRYEATGYQIAVKMERLADALGENSLILSTEKIVFQPETFVGRSVRIGRTVEVSFYGKVASSTNVEPEAPSETSQTPGSSQIKQQSEAPPALASQRYNCPYCRRDLTWIPQYQRWYCYYCGRYA